MCSGFQGSKRRLNLCTSLDSLWPDNSIVIGARWCRGCKIAKTSISYYLLLAESDTDVIPCLQIPPSTWEPFCFPWPTRTAGYTQKAPVHSLSLLSFYSRVGSSTFDGTISPIIQWHSRTVLGLEMIQVVQLARLQPPSAERPANDLWMHYLPGRGVRSLRSI